MRMVHKKQKTSFIAWDECVGIGSAGIDHINMCIFWVKRKKERPSVHGRRRKEEEERSDADILGRDA